jgi:hypothetical protein
MTVPATAQEVVHNLAQLTEELRRTVTAYRYAERDSAEKRHAADMVEARAFLSSEEKTVEAKKYAARESADHAENEALVAEALVRVLRAEIRAIDTRIEVGRTYGATVRAELKTLGMDGST